MSTICKKWLTSTLKDPILYITVNKEGNTMKQTIGFTLIVVGMMAAAGSANDCDGACMDQANTIGEMLMVAGAGLFAMVVGALAVFSAQQD